jgi:hypothetical protein
MVELLSDPNIGALGIGPLPYWTAADGILPGDLAPGLMGAEYLECDTSWREGGNGESLLLSREVRRLYSVGS